MFNFFNKKNFESQEDNEEIKIKVIFPSATDMLEKSKMNWKPLTAEQVLQKIKAESNSGNRIAYFFKSTIPNDICIELENNGYEVEVISSYGTPGFKVSW